MSKPVYEMVRGKIKYAIVDQGNGDFSVWRENGMRRSFLGGPMVSGEWVGKRGGKWVNNQGREVSKVVRDAIELIRAEAVAA